MKEAKTKAETVSGTGLLAAASFIARRGYEIMDTCWECPAGEVGIVARDGENGDLVFIEVRSREDKEKGIPSGELIEGERRRLEGIAGHYLAQNGEKLGSDFSVRFDVVSVLTMPPDRALISHNRDVLGASPAVVAATDWDAVAAALAEGDGNIGLHLDGKKLPEYLRELILADIEASR